jgi:type I restriction enzyme, S subunit
MKTKEVFGQGIIPGYWEIESLLSVGEIVTGTTPSTKISEYYDGNRLFVKPSDLNASTYVDDTATKLTEEGLAQTRTIPKGSVLVTCIGSIGKMGIASKELATNQQINSIIPNKKILTEYLFSNLKFRKGFLEAYANLSLLPIINKTDFGKILIPLPPLVEQRGIAEVLGTVDETIRVQERVIANTELLKQGLMQSLLTEGIGHTEYKQTNLGCIPKKWKMTLSSKICERITDGTHDTPEKTEQGYPLITSKNLRNGEIFFDDSYLISEKDFYEVNKRSKVDSNDLLISMIGTLGQVAIVNKSYPKFAIKNVGLLKFNEDKVMAKWFYYLFNSYNYKKHQLIHAKGTTQKYLPLNYLRNIPIILPEIEEIQAIIKYLEAIDSEIKNMYLERQKYMNIKNGLMQVLFSGERRVEWRQDGLHRIR